MAGTAGSANRPRTPNPSPLRAGLKHCHNVLGVRMKKTMLATAVLLLAASGFASAEVNQLPAERLILAQTSGSNLDQGTTTQVTPEQRKKLQEEAKAKKEAQANMPKQSLSEKEKTAAKNAKNAPATGNLEQGSSTQVSAEERKKLQAEAKARKESNAAMTPEQKKAAAKEKGKASGEVGKGEKGG